MKGQLTRVKNGKLKSFGYGAILIYFSLEGIPLLRPQKALVDEERPQDPWILRWVSLMARHGNNGPMVWYFPEFFVWLSQYIISIEDFPYVGMDYIGDPNILLLVGTQWGDLGENVSFCCFQFFQFLFVFCLLRLIIRNSYVDMGPIWPVGLQSFDRHDDHPIRVVALNLELAEALVELENNLERLTIDIPEIKMDDLPLWYKDMWLGFQDHSGNCYIELLAP